MGRRKKWTFSAWYSTAVTITMFLLIIPFISILIYFPVEYQGYYFLTWLILSFFLPLVLLYYWRRFRENRSIIRKSVIKDYRNSLQDLSPYEFEDAIAMLFKSQGYRNVKKTPSSRDYGADIIMEDKKTKYVVEVKKYAKNNLVGRPLLQKLQGASDYYRATGMKFVTLGYYSNEAVNYAKKSNIHLIDGDELVSMFKKVLK